MLSPDGQVRKRQSNRTANGRACESNVGTSRHVQRRPSCTRLPGSRIHGLGRRLLLAIAGAAPEIPGARDVACVPKTILTTGPEGGTGPWKRKAKESSEEDAALPLPIWLVLTPRDGGSRLGVMGIEVENQTKETRGDIAYRISQSRDVSRRDGPARCRRRGRPRGRPSTAQHSELHYGKQGGHRGGASVGAMSP
ncbi:hypothetical protein ACJZ2D_014623 [Fusarium nematophilum]